jgi:hypothetical protein
MTGRTLRKDVTVYYIVKNEDMWVRQSIEIAKKWVDNILVVDTGSVDNTIEEVKKTGVKLIEHGPMDWELFSKVKNHYMDTEIDTDLVLWVDGNELMMDKGFMWLADAIKDIDLSDPSINPCLSIPQFDVFEVKEEDDGVRVGYYDYPRGRRRLALISRVQFRRGFGRTVVGQRKGTITKCSNSYGMHVANGIIGVFWHMRYVGHSSKDAQDKTRAVRNAKALEHWSKYPKQYTKYPKDQFYKGGRK